MKKIRTLGELRDAINRIVEYNWSDEEEDYEENGGGENHIYQTLLDLDRWANEE